MTVGEDGAVTESLLRELGAEAMRLRRRRTSTYAGSLLEDSAFRILHALEEAGSLSLTDLAHELQLERSTVSRQVSAAVGNGLVERYVARGGRARAVRSTSAGREAYLHDGRLRAAVWGGAIAEFGTDRAAGFLADLRDFNDAVDRAHSG
jgi:DNA-binding MarR family transcriptional regulator